MTKIVFSRENHKQKQTNKNIYIYGKDDENNKINGQKFIIFLIGLLCRPLEAPVSLTNQYSTGRDFSTDDIFFRGKLLTIVIIVVLKGAWWQ